MAALSRKKPGQSWKGGFAVGDYIQHQSALDAIEAERKVVHHESQMECTEEACRNEYVITRVLERLAIRVQIIPAADVRPVVRGRWENFRGKPRCSRCKAVWPEDYYDHNFCPNCGADMRGESGSEEKILHQI